MLLEITIHDASLTINIADPFQPDLDAILAQIEQIAAPKGSDVTALHLRGLLLQMIRGIAGCENGCPANAKSLVSKGYKGFDLRYVEGGILTARTMNSGGVMVSMKIFPEF